MSNKSNLSQAELKELEKLAEEAYYELVLIIEEAIELHDVALLNARISAWKSKYKKVLDTPLPNSVFKEKIKRLLDENYRSELIDQILNYIKGQVKLKEQTINQSKALIELYSIIKETNDLKTLKKKVEEWKAKYPVSEFLNMYKKRISSYTREKNLEDNAFDQDRAFDDLLKLTKMGGTFDDLKNELSNWEETYSIHDKYELDDFVKNQTEVKRYYELLVSISNSQENIEDVKTAIEITPNLSLQDAALNCLDTIIKGRNNVDAVFEWVYLSRNIKFDNNHKERIIAITSRDYPPHRLMKEKMPNINLFNSLSLDEYNNITNIKRYTILSYFNTLLPKELAVSNNFFTKHLKEVYTKSKEIKHSKNTTVFSEELISSGIEISLSKSNKLQDSEENTPKSQPEIEITSYETTNKEAESIDIIAISPLFFEAVHNLSKQADIANQVDSLADETILKTKSQDKNPTNVTRIRID